ncbi:MAG TPA: hypothetical protein DEA75_05700 [Rhodobacteraceae bacterium]|nr:hypothetical protein [Paracoccaceae bacterium]
MAVGNSDIARGAKPQTPRVARCAAKPIGAPNLAWLIVAVVKLGVFAASSLGLVWLAVQFVDLILRLANYVSAFAQF